MTVDSQYGARKGNFSGNCYLVMVIFLRTAHFVLAAVDLVILTAMFLKVPSEGKGLGGLELILDITQYLAVFITISL